MNNAKEKAGKSKKSDLVKFEAISDSLNGDDDDDIEILEIVNKQGSSKEVNKSFKESKSKVEKRNAFTDKTKLKKELKLAKHTINEQETLLKELLDKIENYESQLAESETVVMGLQRELDEAEEIRVNSLEEERKRRLDAEKKVSKLEDLIKCVNVELTSVIEAAKNGGSNNGESKALDDLKNKMILSFATMQTRLANLTAAQNENKGQLAKTMAIVKTILDILPISNDQTSGLIIKTELEVTPNESALHKIKKGNLCQCGKKFKVKSDLNRHIYRFKLEKNFCCKICGVGFKGNWELKGHYQRIHKIKHSVIGIGCAKCGDTFQSRKDLWTHQKDLHNNGV